MCQQKEELHIKIHIKKWASFQSKYKELWYPFLFDLSVVLCFVFSIQ